MAATLLLLDPIQDLMQAPTNAPCPELYSFGKPTLTLKACDVGEGVGYEPLKLVAV